MPGLLLRWWCRLGCNPSLVFSVLLLRRLACRRSLGSATCVRELPWGLWLLFGWQCGDAFWLPMPLGYASGLRCLLRQFAAESAVSAALRGWSSFSGLCLSFTCSCSGVVWSQVCGPSCCSCVLGSCGVSVAPFCRLGLLRALPFRVFA